MDCPLDHVGHPLPTESIQRTYDSTASYVYLGVVLAAYIAVIVAVLGIAQHSKERLGTADWGLPERC